MPSTTPERPPRDNLIRALAQNPVLRLESRESGSAMPVMTGHFAVFDTWTEINSYWEGEFIERLSRGAFKKTFKENRAGIRVLFQHGQDFQVGDKPMGPIGDLREEDAGAYYEVPLLDTSYNRDIIPGLEANLYGASFRFKVMKEELVQNPKPSDYNPKGLPERTIKEVQLMEFGPVTFPAYQDATAGLRSDAVRSLTDAYFLRSLSSRDPEKIRAALDEALSVRDGLAEPTERTDGGSPRSQPDPDEPVTTAEDVEVVIEDESAAPTTLEPETPETPADDEADAAADNDTSDDAEPSPAEPDALPDAGAGDTHSDDDGSRGQEPASTPPLPTRTATPTPVKEIRQMPVPTGMTIEERKTRDEAIQARFQEIHVEYGASPLPEEVRDEWNALIEERSANRNAIKDYERRMQQLALMSDDMSYQDVPGQGAGGVSLADQRSSRGRNATRVPTNVYALEDYRTLSSNMDELRGAYRDGAMKVVEKTTFAHPSAKPDEARARIERLLDRDDVEGRFAQRLLATGNPVYQRAFGKSLKGSPLTVEEQRALSLGSDPDGGFAVPFQLDPTVILTSDGVINPIRALARVETIIGKEWQGVTSTGITVSRAAEADEADDNSPTLDQPVVRAERVQGFVPFSVELGQDWSGIQSEIAILLQDAKDVEESSSFILGNGVGTAAGGVIGTLDAGSITNTVANDAFSVADVYKLEEAVPPRFRSRAHFVANRAIYNKIRQFDTAGGASLWVRLLDGLGNELIGYPAHEASAMASTVADATKILLLGDFKQFLIVDRLGMSIELIPHLFGTNGRPTGQRGVYAIWRNNSVILVDNAFRLLKVQ